MLRPVKSGQDANAQLNSRALDAFAFAVHAARALDPSLLPSLYLDSRSPPSYTLPGQLESTCPNPQNSIALSATSTAIAT
jgi:hypothetical protein